MDLLPLLFGDPTRVQVLRLLARNREGLTRLAIAKRLDRSPSHVAKVVEAFQALGVVAMKEDRRVFLNDDHPLHDPVTETLDRFEPFVGWGRLLRSVIRSANERFKTSQEPRDTRYYVGGYLAATRTLQPIDFQSNRCDLWVKDLRPRDHEWAKTLNRVSPYDVRLHEAHRMRGYVENENATLDDEPCPVALPEVGAYQCLEDPEFPRYGGFLLLVQGIDEWAREGSGYQPARLKTMADQGAWKSRKTIKEHEMRQLIEFIESALQGQREKTPDFLTKVDQKELQNALNTVGGA